MIHTDGPWLKDDVGRTLLLRGVNLGGNAKIPAQPDSPSHRREQLFEHRHVSFVGRPFPLAEADEHFARLKAWGLTFLRFLITWEAIEHDGPGRYDHAYLDYLEAIVAKAGEHGLQLFIDPHQDVWSRFTGGDGAPGWTVEAAGLDMTHFEQTGAALLHALHGDPFPRMIWPTNGTKLACATLFTLFFGGNDFAPDLRVDGEPIQEYLQRHYINAVLQVARRLKDMPHVVGYDTMNEPWSGYIGWKDLTRPKGPVELGLLPSPLQAMALGDGISQDVDVWDRRLTGPRRVGRQRVNPGCVRAWLDGHDCIWRHHGVWDIGPSGPRLLRPDYFTTVKGRPIQFSQDYYAPFARRFAQAIRSVSPKTLIFLETPSSLPPPHWGPDDPKGIVYAPHWYDGYVLFLKDFSHWVAADMHTATPVFLPWRIRKSFAEQLRRYQREAQEHLGNVPVLIGEFGVAFDLHEGRAYKTGDFRAQAAALDRSFRAMEDTLMGCTLWNYSATNSNERGDQWNGEDLSLFSRDQQTDPTDLHSGGRALDAAVRPYAMKVAGKPLRMDFNRHKRLFELEMLPDPNLLAPTEIFVPRLHYPHGVQVKVSAGRTSLDLKNQRLSWEHGGESAGTPGRQTLTLTPARAPVRAA